MLLLFTDELTALINFITTISNTQSILLLAAAIFLAQIMKYVQKTTDEGIDGLREKYFDNQLSRRSVYNLIWICLFLIGYFLCPLTETSNRLIFSLFFALFSGYLFACFVTFSLCIYMLAYDLLSLFAAIKTDKDNSDIQTKRDEVKNEKSNK